MSRYSIGIAVVREFAKMEAKAGRFNAVLPEHLWMGLSRFSQLSESSASKMLKAGDEKKTLLIAEVLKIREWFRQNGMESARARRKLCQLVSRAKSSSGNRPSSESLALFEMAKNIAGSEENSIPDTVHLARSIMENPPPTLAGLFSHTNLATENSEQKQQADGRDILFRFGRDLTAEAAEGKLEPLVGRRKELLRLAQVLSQKRKGNAILVGDAGVGKTCIVEGFALKIVSPECQPAFYNKRIIELSMATLVGGTRYRGDLEKRLESIIREAEADPNLILFIDEFHTVMEKEGEGHGVINIFIPALARGKIRLIAATTTHEYERGLARNESVARRFQVLWVEEPSRADALKIVNGVRTSLERHHAVKISKQAADAAVDLSIRYLPHLRLPDKALDLLDQACAKMRLESLTIKADVTETTLLTMNAQSMTVGRADIARVLSQFVRVPFELIAASDQERMNVLEAYLTRWIIGQEQAMQTVAESLRAAYQELKDPQRPIASFLLAGPSGVGKTETAKAISGFLFGDPESLIRIDLSEYMEKHQSARLIGAPPGYVGSEEPGILTSALRQRPAAVVLFTEIEKAHPEVLNILLQILDEGQLTDGQGRRASFREAVVILTTNIMPADSKKNLATDKRGNDPECSREQVMAALKTDLRPELLGRIHNIILFDVLDRNALAVIADRFLSAILKRLQEQDDIRMPENVREDILKDMENSPYDAPEIERLVESKVAEWMKSFEKGPEPKPELKKEGDVSFGGEILFTVMPATVPHIKTALLVLDLVRSTNFVCDSGDTIFSSLIGRIHKVFKKHGSKSDLLFLKCTGDGFLGVYRTVHAAFSAGSFFLKKNTLSEVSFRLALHWGEVKTGPGGDPLGVEVHRVFRMEGVKAADRVISDDDRHEDEALPESGRLITSKQALEQLAEEDQALFHPAGQFRLKGFSQPFAIWVTT